MAYIAGGPFGQRNKLTVKLCMPAWIGPFDAGSVDTVERDARLCHMRLRVAIEEMASLEADCTLCDEKLQEVAAKLSLVIGDADIQVFGLAKYLERDIDALVSAVGYGPQFQKVSPAQYDRISRAIDASREIALSLKANLMRYQEESSLQVQEYEHSTTQYNVMLLKYLRIVDPGIWTVETAEIKS